MRTKKKPLDVLLNMIILCLLIISGSDAAVSSVYKVQPSKAGTNGGTKVTIDGTGFSENNYEGGNNVVFVSKSLTRTYGCEVSKDGTTEVQILCTTIPMDPGEYYVRVYVDNEAIPDDFLCGGNPFRTSCRLVIDSKSTPKISEVIPRSQSVLPGSIIELCGLIMSSVYGSHISQDEVTNGVTAQILRVYAGYQLCELKKDADDLYGIVLNDGGLSMSGCLKCRMTGTFIGNSNASIIIDGPYGRSMPDMNILRVSANDQLYMIQTYAEITGISPSSGSTAGGLRLTISGKYFDTNVQAMVGGTACEVEGEVTPDSFTCVTSAQSSSSPYAGNRGLMLEAWNGTSSTFADLITTLSSLTGSEANYISMHIDQFFFKESMENSVSRIKGFFVPPHTGEYAFLLRGNKGAKLFVTTDTADSMNPATKVEVVTSSSMSYRASSRYTLQAATLYYIEAIHQVDTGDAELQVAAKFFNTAILSSMTGFSKAERQRLNFQSKVVREEQIVNVTGFNSVTHTKEVQQVVVMESAGNSDATFQLIMFGVATEPMTTRSTASEIQNRLNDLAFLHSHETFTVTTTEITTPSQGIDITITFNSERGEFPKFEPFVIPGSSNEMLTVTVSRTTAGVPSGHYYALTHTGMTTPSPLIKPDATAQQVENALSMMYGARCLKPLINPAGKFIFYNYESSWPVGVSGTKTNKVEPFCGRYVAMNLVYLYRDVVDDSKGILLTTSVFKLCFAYRGGELQDRIYFGYYYSVDDQFIWSAVNVPVTFNTEENKWHYFCLDMMATLRAIRPTASQFYVKHIRVFKLGDVSAYYIDDVLIGRKAPVGNTEGITDYRIPPMKPNGALIKEVIVTSDQTGVYTIKHVPHDCGFNFSPLTAIAPLVTGGQVTVNEVEQASQPLTGTFDVTFNGHTVTGLPYSIEGDALAEEMESTPGIGNLDIGRYGDCANFRFDIKFLSTPGDVEQILIDGSNIDGVEVTVTAQTLENGGLLYDPLPGDMLRTFHTAPQVTVVVNDVPSLCSGDCGFDWSAAQTPTLTGSSPATGFHGDVLTLQGTGFDGSTPENNVVLTGTVPCTVVTATATTITCTVGQGPVGVSTVTVRVVGKGLASGTSSFTFQHEITSFSPATVSLGGGIPLLIVGRGFSEEVVVTVNDVACDVTDVTSVQITCILPAVAAGSYNVVAKHGSTIYTSAQQIVYDAAITPSISSVTPTTSGVSGGETLTISGSGFGTSGTLLIGDTEVAAVFTDTQITATLPLLPPGSHKVLVFSGSTGAAVNSLNQLPVILYQLEVTNVTPLSGSMHGGTRVTLTGQGFSTNTSETVVMVGEHNCVIQSATLTEIVCQIEDTGDVVDISNNGTHKVFGHGFDWYPKNTELKVGDIARWSWSIPYPFMVFRPRVMEVKGPNTLEQPEDGFVSAASRSGVFTYRVSIPGIYPYSSGWIDENQLIRFHGTLHVAPRDQFVGDISLKIAGHEAIYDINSGVSPPSPSTTCGEDTSTLPGCTDDPPTGGAANKFSFLFSNCSTPTVCTFSINQGTTSDILMIEGEGFSTTACQNLVMIGNDVCHVVSSDGNYINCSLDAADEPRVGKPQMISVTVLNRGHALVIEPGQIARTFVLLPMISMISPSMLSINGQGLLKVEGSGFVGSSSDIFVTVEMMTCVIESVTYTEITCRAPPMSAGDYVVEVKVSIEGQLISAICKDANECNVTYNELNTPKFTAVSPQTLDGSSTTVTITGEGFGTDTSQINVKIGGVECLVSSVIDTEIQCTIANVPVGSQDIKVLRHDKGLATNTNDIMINSTAVISSIAPGSGSIHGGTVVQIDGNGFKDDVTVTIDGSVCSITMVTLSLVKCTSPAHSAADVPVVVMSNGITYPTQTISYTVANTPEITSISPTSVENGQTIYINGNGFLTPASKNTVTVGSVDCPVVTASSTLIQCTAPAVPLGTHNVVVHVDGKGLSNNDKTIMYSISISSINPSTGSVGGGQTVTISGSGFRDDTMVTICGQECDHGTVAADSIVCLTPLPSGAVSGTLSCDVKVESNSVMDTLTDGYTFDSGLTPTVTMVTPRRGGSGGGVTLTVQGTGFQSSVPAVVVKVGSTACVVSSVTDTVITCVTEPHPTPEVTTVSVEVNGNGLSVEGSEGDARFEVVDLWSSPYTWGGNPPPENGTLVVIEKGQTIVLDTDTNYLKVLLIKGGHLIFDEKDVKLMADNILIVDGGSLTIGTEDQPFLHRAEIMCAAHVRTKELPIYGTCSIGVRNGTLDIHGMPVDVTWTVLAATATAGSNQITVYDAVNTGSRPWARGDQIVIATTGGSQSQRETEVRYIDSVANDGVTITLTEPLEYDHLGTSETFGTNTFQYRAEVGMYTRNILLRGFDDPQWNDDIENCEKGADLGEFAVQTCFQGRFGEEVGNDQFGIQVIIHPPIHSIPGVPETQLAVSRISNTEWYYAGQAFRLGRYPMHFHLMGDASQSYIKKCALHKTFNRAVNIHGSHNVTVEDNVIYNVMGGAFFLEDGIETWNTFEHNLALFVQASTSLLNDDVSAAAFWVTNAHNNVKNNAAAGGTHFGFWYRTELVPRGPSRTTSVNPVHDGNVVFEGNTVHSCGWFGLWLFPEFLPRDNARSSGSPIAAVFSDFYVYNCEKGAETVFAGEVQFVNFRMVNNKVGIEHKQIVEGDYFSADGALIKDSVIVGKSSVLPTIPENAGIILPLTHRLLVDNIEFYGFTETNTAAFKYASITGKSSAFSGGFETHTQNLQFTDVGTNHRGIFDWEFHGYIIDQDGSLIGQPDKSGWSVVTTSNLLPSTCLDFPAFSHPGKTAAKICPPDVRLHRFSFNKVHPESLDFKNFLISNSNGQAVVPWARKRMTHPKGWMLYMPGQTTYDISWENAEHMTNISFSGRLDRFKDGDWVILKTRVAQKPDCVETDGICVNETEAASLDGAVHYHGDWIYVPNEMSISYLVSHREHSARRRKRAVNSDSNIILNFNLYKCLYPDCIPPPDPGTLPPADTRPDDAVFWNETSSWPNDTLPVDGDCVTIPEGTWMVANTVIPPLCELILYGVLELEANDGDGGYRHFEIKTPHIVVMGTGRLIAGFNKDQPFLGSLDIILQGSHSSPSYIVQPDGRDVGAKSLSSFGGLDLNGKQVAMSWTTLAVTGEVGDSNITLSEVVDWSVGSDIVITPTGYDPWHTETFKITAVSSSGDRTVLSINGTLQHKHLVVNETINEKDWVLAAEVGLLSRNIRIIGEDYPDLYPESFGGRVLIGASSLGTGYARLSNVEFYHMGQEGYTEWYDPRYAVAFVDAPVGMSRPSYVESCAFHNSFAPSIGIYNSHGLAVVNNVIHHSVGWAIQTNSANNEMKGNLVTLTLWPGSYQDRVEVSNFDHDGAISAITATDLTLVGNSVSAGERTCYHIPPQSCDPSATGLYSDNQARTCLFGIMVQPVDQLSGDCGRFTGFTISKCPYYGIYYNNWPSLQVDNVCIADSAVGIFPMVIGPPSVSHSFADKFVKITNSLIIGKSGAFDCNTDVLNMTDDNVRLTSTSRPFEPTRRIGVIFGQFTSGSNKFPEKPALNIMAYQAIKGITQIEDVTFAGFNDECNSNGTAITTNKNNDDGQHPVEVQRLTFVGVSEDHRVFYDRPRLEVIDDSNCVDMDCDGLKKALVKDLDGSLLGAVGAVIPQAEFEWNGDPRRGLGDYRIPKSLLTTVTGVRIPPAEYKGVIRNQSCVYHERWQAYECLDLNYEMLVIESMDEDTEIRRISPVAIQGYDREGYGYVDLINGPQDHGWCNGYTCRKRLSTFQALVITDRRYLLHFTGTTPRDMRYFLLNTQDTDCIVLGVFYSNPYRLDLYHDGSYVPPKNYEGKEINGQTVYTLKPETYVNEYVPVPSDRVGSNWFDRDEGMFYFQMCGPMDIQVKTQMAVIISFKYPPATIDEFYGDLIVEYIAEFFDIPYSKVRVVDIVRADSTRRRKRSTDGPQNDAITLEIGDAPSYDVNGTVDDPLTWEQLQGILATAINEAQLGNFSVVVNNKIIDVSVAPPRTANDPLWATVNDGTLGGYKIVVVVDRLDIHQTILPNHEGVPFLQQPKIKVLDAYGNRISELGTPDHPWFVTASLMGGNPSAELLGNTTVQFMDGWANFTNLGISYFGTGYYLEFNISSPPQGMNFSVSSEMIDIPVREVKAVVINTTDEVTEQTDLSVTLELRDSISGLKVEDIAWRNHAWNVEVTLSNAQLSIGSLSGSTQMTFDTGTSQASFSTLQFSTYGFYVVKFHVTTVPPEYDFEVKHLIRVRGQHHGSMVMEENTEIILKFGGQYSAVVGNEPEYMLGAYLGDWFAHEHSQIEVLTSMTRSGSVVLTLTIQGTATNVNDTLYATCNDIINGTTVLNYNGHDLSLTPYMTNNGQKFYGAKCGPIEKEDDDDYMLAVIIACSVVTVVLVIIIIFLVWKCKVIPKTKTSDSKGKDWSDVDDILVREKSFMSVGSYGKTAPMATGLLPGSYYGQQGKRTADGLDF